MFRAATDILNSRSNSLCNNSTFTASFLIRVCWSNRHYCIACRSAFTAEENLAGGGVRRILSRCATPVSGRSMWTRPARPTQCAGECRICAGCKSSLRPSAMCSVASLVRVTWCFDCSPHGSAGSTGHAEAVVGFTCPKPAGRRCWVATAGDCTFSLRKFGGRQSLGLFAGRVADICYCFVRGVGA